MINHKHIVKNFKPIKAESARYKVPYAASYD